MDTFQASMSDIDPESHNTVKKAGDTKDLCTATSTSREKPLTAKKERPKGFDIAALSSRPILVIVWAIGKPQTES